VNKKSKANICPVCGKKTYREYDFWGEDFSGKPIITGDCSYCGFTYHSWSEDDLQQQARAYIKHLEARVKKFTNILKRLKNETKRQKKGYWTRIVWEDKNNGTEKD